MTLLRAAVVRWARPVLLARPRSLVHVALVPFWLQSGLPTFWHRDTGHPSCYHCQTALPNRQHSANSPAYPSVHLVPHPSSLLHRRITSRPRRLSSHLVSPPPHSLAVLRSSSAGLE